MPLSRFLLSQLGYIRKWVWIAAALISLTAIIGAQTESPHLLWVLSACTPLLALTIISESGRSRCYEMEELEMATRFSLRSVVLARLGLLGIFNLFLLVLLICIGCGNSPYRPLTVGIYISVPFLLTTFLGLSITRKFRGQEGLYACAGSALCVSILVFLTRTSAAFLYGEPLLIWWIAGLIALCIGIGQQYRKLIAQTEDLSWN